MSDALAALAETIRAAGAGDKRLRIRGGGTKDFYGQALEGEVLDTRGYAGIVAYEPTELVITVRGGTPLAEVEAALAGERQMLAFEPPHFGAGGDARRRRRRRVVGSAARLRRAECATSCSACG